MRPTSLVSEEVLSALIEKARASPTGALVEVGVFQGGSASRLHDLALEQGRRLYLYDTFEGIPWKADLDLHPIGDFVSCDAESVRRACPRAIVIPGIFPNSAVEMGPIAFVHLDVDQYRSYREAIDFLLPKMTRGGVMWFDDSTCLSGANKAVTESFGDRLRLSAGKHFVEF